MSTPKKIVILGNGIAGITAARHIRKNSDDDILVVSGESEHFFSRTALMYIYMGHMQYEHTKPYEDHFWVKNRIRLLKAWVTGVDVQGKTLQTHDGKVLSYDILVLATGSVPAMAGWPGQHLKGVGGLVSLQDLERMESATRNISHAVVVGGGLIGIEMVEMLLSRRIPVTFLVREFSFWNSVLPPQESDMVTRHIREHGVDLRLQSELDSILDDGNGKVRAVRTTLGEEITCGFVGIAIGVRANIGFLEGSGIETDRGILVNEYFETNVPDVYAIGDCARFRAPLPGRAPQEQIWYTGRMHGETVALSIAGQRTAYRPVNFYNSAKLFDIEYQVYSREVRLPAENESSLYWEHPDGKRGIRLYWDRQTGAILALNLMGIRYRHVVCDRWIQEGWHIEDVLRHLPEANADPEFSVQFEAAVVAAYNRQEGRSVPIPAQNPGILSRIAGIFQ